MLTSKCKVRAFIPRERILDVIVMEIVWPHCVWSQVAFRVDNGHESSLAHQSQSCNDHEADENGVVEHRRRRRHQQPTGCMDSKVHNNDNDETNGEKVINTDSDQRSTLTKRSQNIHALLKQNRIAIVPAFPEECRGLLSYKECLQLQEEIERLLER